MEQELQQFLFNIVDKIEKNKGSPATFIECRQEFIKNPGDFTEHKLSRGIFYNLWLTNTCYIEKTGSYISLQRWNDDYFTYQEKFDNRFKPLGYIIDDRSRIRASQEAKTIEFGELIDLLSSSDEGRLKDYEWMF